MDDLLGLVVLIVFYVFAAAARKNKKSGAKTAQKRRAQTRRTSQESWEEIRQNLTRAMETLEAAKEAPKPVQVEGLEHQAQPCSAQSVHLHEATQQQMLGAQEGEDPCYAGGVELISDASETGVGMEQSALAQDLLRGVIMSEILTRPCNRARGWNVKRGA